MLRSEFPANKMKHPPILNLTQQWKFNQLYICRCVAYFLLCKQDCRSAMFISPLVHSLWRSGRPTCGRVMEDSAMSVARTTWNIPTTDESSIKVGRSPIVKVSEVLGCHIGNSRVRLLKNQFLRQVEKNTVSSFNSDISTVPTVPYVSVLFFTWNHGVQGKNFEAAVLKLFGFLRKEMSRNTWRTTTTTQKKNESSEVWSKLPYMSIFFQRLVGVAQICFRLLTFTISYDSCFRDIQFQGLQNCPATATRFQRCRGGKPV